MSAVRAVAQARTAASELGDRVEEFGPGERGHGGQAEDGDEGVVAAAPAAGSGTRAKASTSDRAGIGRLREGPNGTIRTPDPPTSLSELPCPPVRSHLTCCRCFGSQCRFIHGGSSR